MCLECDANQKARAVLDFLAGKRLETPKMPKATSDARAVRRIAGSNDENERHNTKRQIRADESYAMRYRTPSNTDAFMTPDHDNQQKMQHQQQQQQRKQDFEWHYQETPPAQIQHSRQPNTTYMQTEAQYNGGGDVARGFKTPELADSRTSRRPPVAPAAAANHSITHTSDGGEQQQFQTAAEFAQSQYRRRNRLEKRLEELREDVASLTLKLRSSSNRSNSTAYQSTDRPIAPPPPPLSEVPLNSERLDRGDRPSQQQRKVMKPPPPSPVVKIKKTRVVDKPRPRSSEWLLSQSCSRANLVVLLI